ncbi:MAG: DUF805 domain-containing protein [Pseudomonadota bacterium]
MASKQSMKWLLLSLDGRVTRSTWWFFWVVSMAAFSGSLVVDFMVGTFDMESGFGLINLAVSLLLFWPWLAVNVKRLHDRDRSGWFLLLLIVPLVNLWIMIELAFLAGTAGDNRFGEDRRAAPGVPAAA